MHGNLRMDDSLNKPWPCIGESLSSMYYKDDSENSMNFFLKRPVCMHAIFVTIAANYIFSILAYSRIDC